MVVVIQTQVDSYIILVVVMVVIHIHNLFVTTIQVADPIVYENFEVVVHQHRINDAFVNPISIHVVRELNETGTIFYD